MAPGVMEYVRSPKLPPLVFEAQTCAKDSTYVGVDVVRCRRNGLANAPFLLPILCLADGVEPVDGVLPDLGFVEGCCDARQSCLNLLPYVGPGWYPKVSLAAMLELGVCRWNHIVLGISARSHVDAATLRRALERMDAAWQGEEHMAKLSVNAMIGLWARSTEVVYSVRSSSSELDGAGADFSQAFAYEGGMVWDFVYARRLLSNGTYRPIHDAALGFEHCMVAKARRILDAPPRYLAQVKTDCLLTQRLPKRFAERLRALEALRHPDGTPVYRVEETKPLLGSRAPRMEAERPKQRRWNGVDDPVGHCLAGNSLLLTGLPGTGKTYLRALAPEGSKLLELDVIHMGCCQTTNGCCQTATPQNSPQSMRVWPGLRLIGAGGKIPKGVFVVVAEVEPDGVRLDNGMRLKNQELLRATRPSHAVTYASCQGLTLHNRVRLDLESCHLTLRHLYVGASRATSSELLEA